MCVQYREGCSVTLRSTFNVYVPHSHPCITALVAQRFVTRWTLICTRVTKTWPRSFWMKNSDKSEDVVCQTFKCHFNRGGIPCWVGMNKCSQGLLIFQIFPRVLVLIVYYRESVSEAREFSKTHQVGFPQGCDTDGRSMARMPWVLWFIWTGCQALL